MKPCPFCEIVGGESPATIYYANNSGVVIEPLGPVVRGHVLAIPWQHADDWTSDPTVSAAAMRVATEYARFAGMEDCNLITSRGPAATQSVYHLHLHIVPRVEGDGLALPWSSGKSHK